MVLKIVNVSRKDTGNQCLKLSKAINGTFPGKHESRAFSRVGPTFTGFEQDVLWSPHWKKQGIPSWIVDYFHTANVIHRHAFWSWSKGWPPINRRAGRVLNQHGRFGQEYSREEIWEEDDRYRQIRVVSTLNLLDWVKGRRDRWLPPPMDIDKISAIVRKHRKKKKDEVVVAHAPTLRRLKGTDLFLEVMKDICARYKNVRVLLIEGRKHTEALALRVNADIYYDQLLLQYGTAGLEAMVMGQPVVAGCEDRTWAVMEDMFTIPPFVKATRLSLSEVIEELILEEEYRKYMGEVGRAYVRKYHCFENVAKIAIDLYREAIACR